MGIARICQIFSNKLLFSMFVMMVFILKRSFSIQILRVKENNYKTEPIDMIGIGFSFIYFLFWIFNVWSIWYSLRRFPFKWTAMISIETKKVYLILKSEKIQFCFNSIKFNHEKSSNLQGIILVDFYSKIRSDTRFFYVETMWTTSHSGN